MIYAKPEHTRGQVDRAGDTLRDAFFVHVPDEDRMVSLRESFSIMSNWRSSHAFPLNTVTVSLKKHAKQVDSNALVAQRLKRVPSIIDKLGREPGMKLSRMQDIGGCRAVVNDVDDIEKLSQSLKESRMKHVLKREFDYIKNPKASGYRGIHLIYRYNSDRNEIYNKMQIEIQIRSVIQHAWATAVETVGTFLKSSLKASQGPDDWLDFFGFASSAFSRLEGTPRLHSTMSDAEIAAHLGRRARVLQVRTRLQKYGNALRLVESFDEPDARYFLMLLEPKTRELSITSYRSSELAKANAEYIRLEQTYSASDGYEIVLVAAESIFLLRQAYPNYFLDTKMFLELLDQVIPFRASLQRALPGVPMHAPVTTRGRRRSRRPTS